MTTKMKKQRSFNCKDEELPTIGGYVNFSANRDQADFLAYSPVFNPEYFTLFGNRVAAVTELVIPQGEIKAMKAITARLYTNMDGLTAPMDHLVGYVNLAKEKIHISATDFGLTALRRKATAKDAEGVMQYLRLVIANIAKFRDALVEVGFTDELEGKFTAALAEINADNQTQYEMTRNRQAIVSANIDVLNDMFTQMMKICDIGKRLYKESAPRKTLEYTFADLKRKVRNEHKGKGKDDGKDKE